jgi:hypothetical protein
LIIAQNSHLKQVKPADLPVELKQALESPFANVRLGALEELNVLLNSSSPALTSAARIALEKLKDDDSKKVSDTVYRYLAESAVSKPMEETPLIPNNPLTESSLKVSISPPSTLNTPTKLSKPIAKPLNGKLWLKWLGILFISVGLFVVVIMISNPMITGNSVALLYVVQPIIGGITGILQWLIIRQYIPRSGYWIFINIAAFLLLSLFGAVASSIVGFLWIRRSQKGIL